MVIGIKVLLFPGLFILKIIFFEWLIKYFSAFKQFVNSLDCLVGVSWPIHSARALRASPAYALVNAQAFM